MLPARVPEEETCRRGVPEPETGGELGPGLESVAQHRGNSGLHNFAEFCGPTLSLDDGFLLKPMADSPKQRASSLAEEPQQDDALASDDEDGAPAAKPHPPVGGSPKPHPPVTGSPKRPGETPLRARSKTSA